MSKSINGVTLGSARTVVEIEKHLRNAVATGTTPEFTIYEGAADNKYSQFEVHFAYQQYDATYYGPSIIRVVTRDSRAKAEVAIAKLNAYVATLV